MNIPKRLSLMALCLIVGIGIGLFLSGQINSLAADRQMVISSMAGTTIPHSEHAVWDAVPSAAHLSLWEEDDESFLPIILQDY